MINQPQQNLPKTCHFLWLQWNHAISNAKN